MNKKIFVFCFLISVIYIKSYSQTIIEKNTNIKGIWVKEKSPYIVEGVIQIAENDTLIIESGVEVLFNPSNILHLRGGIFVNGVLKANGTKQEPVKFSRNGDSKYWGAIVFRKSINSELNFCEIEYGAGGQIYQANILIDNSFVKINNITLKNIPEIAIWLIFKSSAIIANSKISNTPKEWIYVSHKSKLYLRNSLIENCQKSGIKVIDNSFLDISNCNFLYNKYAIDFNGDSLKIRNSIIWGNYYVFNSYNPAYDITQCIIQDDLIKSNSRNKYNKLFSQNIMGNPIDFPDMNTKLMLNHYLAYPLNHNNINIWIGIEDNENN